MSATPMLETKEQETAQPAEIVMPAEIVATDEVTSYETKATSLRRACTALLFFSVLCARPWPSITWLGVLAAVSVLCAAPHKLLCRTRFTRFLSAVVAVFAAYSFIRLLAFKADTPQRAGEWTHDACVKMPGDTFSWGHAMLTEHKCTRKALAFFSRHMADAPTLASMDKEAGANASLATLTLGGKSNASLATLGPEEEWSQAEACDKAAHLVTRITKMMMVGWGLAHLLLFLSAVAVVKRACRLRCAAYKCGLLKWNKCGCACKNTAPTAVVPAKEIA